MTGWQFFWSLVFGITPCPVDNDEGYYSWRVTALVIVVWLIFLTGGS